MIILGIETSCDETAAAVVSEDKKIYAHICRTQLDSIPYGGVVPEIAARQHLEVLPPLVKQTMDEAGCSWEDLAGIAVTAGPGLIGGVMVGTTFAKAMAMALEKPLIAVNHLEAHALTVRLTHTVEFPYLMWLISGGHCQLLVVRGVGQYQCLGETRDDAVGEAFDKVARLLDLGFPGGPKVEGIARAGDPKRFALPRPMLHHAGCDVSFSGLKTAVRTLQEQGAIPDAQAVADVCAGFQHAVAEVLSAKAQRALQQCREHQWPITALVVAGGAGANETIRGALVGVAAKANLPFIAPPIPLCTDNGVMIAWAGIERARLGLWDAVDFAPRPRWPLAAMDAK